MRFHFLVILSLFSIFSACSGEQNNANNGLEIMFDAGVDSSTPTTDMVSSDAKTQTDMQETDTGITKPTKWDACTPESYSEAFVNPDAPMDDLIAGFDPNNYQAFVVESLKRRAPFGAWIVEEVNRAQNFDCVKEYAEQYVQDGPLELLYNATTIVHECSHAINMATWNGTTHDYYIRLDETYQVPIIEGPGRRVIKDYLLWEDIYTDTYLDLSGEQHFDMVLEEVSGYVNGLIAGLAFIDVAYEGKKVSVRDGSATLLLYMAIYLHHTRLNATTTYESIVNSERMRIVILALWDRGQLALKLSEGYPEIGIEDVKILAELDKFADEISRVRTLHCEN